MPVWVGLNLYDIMFGGWSADHGSTWQIRKKKISVSYKPQDWKHFDCRDGRDRVGFSAPKNAPKADEPKKKEKDAEPQVKKTQVSPPDLTAFVAPEFGLTGLILTDFLAIRFGIIHVSQMRPSARARYVQLNTMFVPICCHGVELVPCVQSRMGAWPRLGPRVSRVSHDATFKSLRSSQIYAATWSNFYFIVGSQQLHD